MHMRTNKNDQQHYDLPSSLLVLGEAEGRLNGNAVLEALVTRTHSQQTQDVVNAWGELLRKHTIDWKTAQWKGFSIEKLWEEITARIPPPQLVYVYKPDNDGNMRPYVLHNGRVIENDQWGPSAEHYYGSPTNPGFSPQQDTHPREALPLMIIALVDMAVDQFRQYKNVTAFTAVIGCISQEYRSEKLIAYATRNVMKEVAPKEMGVVLHALNDDLPFDIVQPLWIKAGVNCAEFNWINKGLNDTTDTDAIQLLWSAIAATSHVNTKQHMQVWGDALFGEQSMVCLEEQSGSCVRFKRALHKLLAMGPSEERFKAWCKNRSTQALYSVFDVITAEVALTAYIAPLLDVCNTDQRLNFVQKIVHSRNTPALKNIPEDYVQHALEEGLKDGDLNFANLLIEKTALPISEQGWDMFWSGVESEYPAFGRGLRAMMERKLMEAALSDNCIPPTPKTRKM